MQYQILHFATGFVLSYFHYINFPNVIRLNTNPDSNEAWTVWNLTDGGYGDNSFYICNSLYGTCLGTLHPVSSYDIVGAEDRTKATGKQLLWYYNATTKMLTSAEDTGLVLTIPSAPSSEEPYPIVQYRDKLSPSLEAQEFYLTLAN